jgi:hypothetical protein
MVGLLVPRSRPSSLDRLLLMLSLQVLCFLEFAVVLEEPGEQIHIGFQAVPEDGYLCGLASHGDSALDGLPVIEGVVLVQEFLLLESLETVSESLVEHEQDLLPHAQGDVLEMAHQAVDEVEVVVADNLCALGGPAYSLPQILKISQYSVLRPLANVVQEVLHPELVVSRLVSQLLLPDGDLELLDGLMVICLRG